MALHRSDSDPTGQPDLADTGIRWLAGSVATRPRPTTSR